MGLGSISRPAGQQANKLGECSAHKGGGGPTAWERTRDNPFCGRGGIGKGWGGLLGTGDLPLRSTYLHAVISITHLDSYMAPEVDKICYQGYCMCGPDCSMHVHISHLESVSRTSMS